MIYAGQKALFQEQNQKVLDIRQAELDYFIHFYTNVITQIAIILGSVIGSASNIKEHDDSYALSDAFYFSAAVTFGLGMHVLICATFIVVLAPNLALHGPIGSMISSVDGMIQEKEHVFLAFLACLISWSINQILMFWLLMTDAVATVSTIMLLAFGSLWYSYTLRIYNRFKMYTSTGQFEEELKVSSRQQDTLKALKNHKLERLKSPTLNGKKSNDSSYGINSMHEDSSSATRSVVSALHAESTISTSKLTSAVLDEEINGYMSFCIRSISRSQAILQRKFFALELKLKILVYYSNESHYQSDPSKPESPRPIKLSDYTLSEIDSSSVPYSILIKDNDGGRGDIEFVVDTLVDLQLWSDAFRFCCKTQDEDDDF